MSPNGLTRQERLSKPNLKLLFKNGKGAKGVCGKLIYYPNGLLFSRFAVTLSKKFGNAVERNYAKRLFKEIYRCHKSNIISGYDLVFVLYPCVSSFNFYEEVFMVLCKKIRLLKQSE